MGCNWRLTFWVDPSEPAVCDLDFEDDHERHKVPSVVTRVTRPTISKLLNGKADLSPEMALCIEKASGISMDTLLRMQVSFDIAQACKKNAAIKVPRYVREPSVA